MHARAHALQIANETNVAGFSESNFMGPMIIGGNRTRVRLLMTCLLVCYYCYDMGPGSQATPG